MNTIVLGYGSHDNAGRGTGPATLIAGSELESQKQYALVVEKRFPKGIVFAEIVRCERIAAAIADAPKPETKNIKKN